MRDLTASQRKIIGSERHIWPNELAFAEAIYADRLELIQQDMLARGLSVVILFDPENMYWLTGYQTIGYFTFQAMCIPASGKPVIVTRVVNRDMALALPTIGNAIAVFDTQDHVDILEAYLKDTVPTGQIGIDTTSRYLSICDYTRLVDRLGGRFKPFINVIEAHRMVKTLCELDRMRAAASAV